MLLLVEARTLQGFLAGQPEGLLGAVGDWLAFGHALEATDHWLGKRGSLTDLRLEPLFGRAKPTIPWIESVCEGRHETGLPEGQPSQSALL